MASAASTPVLAQPDRCRAEAWAFCDPYWPRSDPEWQACVANYIENCYIPEPQCPRSPCPTAGPKVDVSALKKMVKSIA